MSHSQKWPAITPPAAGEIVDIAPGLRWLRMPLPIRIGHVNSYLIEDHGGWAVVDPGFTDERSLAIWESLLAGELRGQRVTRIIVTHHHVDHSGISGWLHERTGAPLFMSEIEYLAVRLREADSKYYGRPGFQSYLRRNGVNAETALAIAKVLASGLGFSTIPDSFVSLAPGESIAIGSRRLDILIGSGHATGQVMLHCPDENWMLMADQLLGSLQPLMILPHFEPDGNPYKRLLRSLDEIEALVDGKTLALPGHYQPFRGVPGAIARLRRHHDGRCRKVLELCRATPLSAAELATRIFAAELNPRQLNHAIGEIIPYGNRLVEQGLARWIESDPSGARKLSPV